MQIDLSINSLPNFAEIEAAALRAFRETVLIMDAEYKLTISDPNAFARLGFTNQDIVDTGRLRASQQFNFAGTGKAIYSWPVDYSIYVHEGYTLRNGRQQLGRPWTDETVKRANPQGIFDRILGGAL